MHLLSIRTLRNCVCTAACLFAAAAAFAEDFRIETRIFVGQKTEDEKPVSQSTTLFRAGAVYDFLAEPAQAAVFRKATGGKPGRFILLDWTHEIQTEFTTDQLARFSDKVRNMAATHSDPFVKHASNPKFDEEFEPDSGKLVLASYWESYTVATGPAEHADALPEYREFLDWYARLNALLHPGLPPEPRLRLNEALARRRVLPLSVELTRAGSEEPIRAEHQFTWRLSRDDMQRIDDVATALASFRKVENEAFLKTTQPAAPKDAN
jgi:hypothetical protein